jgi:hypothetical protein
VPYSTCLRARIGRPRQAVLGGPDSSLRARLESELCQDVLHVDLSCRLCNNQRLGDGAVAEPAREQCGDLALARQHWTSRGSPAEIEFLHTCLEAPRPLHERAHTHPSPWATTTRAMT